MVKREFTDRESNFGKKEERETEIVQSSARERESEKEKRKKLEQLLLWYGEKITKIILPKIK